MLGRLGTGLMLYEFRYRPNAGEVRCRPNTGEVRYRSNAVGG